MSVTETALAAAAIFGTVMWWAKEKGSKSTQPLAALLDSVLL
jgi:hypothetical protein